MNGEQRMPILIFFTHILTIVMVLPSRFTRLGKFLEIGNIVFVEFIIKGIRAERISH